MIRIIHSLFIILVVVTLVSSSTTAYFSDVEVSEENTFVAGALDLQVDSEAHYNGMICLDGTWVGEEQEEEEEPQEVVIIEQVQDNGPGVGSIDEECRDFGFDFGIVKWEYHEECNHCNGEPCELPTEAEQQALISDDETITELSPEITDQETNGDSCSISTNVEIDPSKYNWPDWDWYNYIGGWHPEGGDSMGTYVIGNDHSVMWYVGTSGADGIVVKAGNTVHYGINGIAGLLLQCNPALSHITFCGYDDPNECVGTWELTDLEDGEHILFNFQDLRVGDYGENTISLHVQDNDAWARIVIDNIIDEDNGCVEPELDDDLDCDAIEDPGGAGELRESMLFTIWLDHGSVPGFTNSNLSEEDDGYDSEEGDNIYQHDTEPILFEDLILDPTLNEWSLGDTIAFAYDTDCTDVAFLSNGHNEHGACHGLSEGGYLVGETTYYFGLAWELPEGTTNAIQSDVFGGDVHFEIEQQRHNDLPFTN